MQQSILNEGRAANLGSCDMFVDSICDDPLSRCYVAYLGDKMAGILIASYLDQQPEPGFEVRHLYVAHDFRASGVAQALMDKMLSWTFFFPDNRNVFITTEGEPRPYYRALGFEPTHRICVSSLKKLREKLRG